MFKAKQLLLFVLLIPIVSGISLGRTQSAGGKGILLCHGQPEPNVLIKLYDHDTLSIDDLMNTAYTDSRGYFEVSGVAHEFLTIDAKLNFYHGGRPTNLKTIFPDCDDRIVPCQRKFSIELPSSYISSGEHPEKYYNVGVLELSGKFGDESRDCIH